MTLDGITGVLAHVVAWFGMGCWIVIVVDVVRDLTRELLPVPSGAS